MIIYLREEKNAGQTEEEEKVGVRNTSVSTDARGEGATDAGAETPLQPLEQPTLKQRSD